LDMLRNCVRLLPEERVQQWNSLIILLFQRIYQKKIAKAIEKKKSQKK